MSRFCSAAICLTLLLVLPLSAQIIRDDFRVSDDRDTIGHEYTEVACAPDGHYVVSWLEVDGGRYEIHARLYAPGGKAISDEIDVTRVNHLSSPEYSLAMSESGEFAFAWIREYSATRNEVLITRFNSNGTFFVNGSNVIWDYRGGMIRHPDVALDTNGNTVVTASLTGDSAGTWMAVCPGVQMPSPNWMKVDTLAYRARVAVGRNNRITTVYRHGTDLKFRLFSLAATPAPIRPP